MFMLMFTMFWRNCDKTKKILNDSIQFKIVIGKMNMANHS